MSKEKEVKFNAPPLCGLCNTLHHSNELCTLNVEFGEAELTRVELEPITIISEDAMKDLQEMHKIIMVKPTPRYKIDMTKIHTLEDVIRIISALDITVTKDSDVFKNIEEYTTLVEE